MPGDFIIEDVTQGELESVGRIESAIRAVIAVVLPNKVQAGAGLLGLGLGMMLEYGEITEELAVAQVRHWYANQTDLKARIARLSIRAVPELEKT